jgi:rod shape-determining protein MreD
MRLASSFSINKQVSQFKIWGTLFGAILLDQFHVFRFLPVEPLFTMPVLYFWSLYVRDSFPIYGVFLAGIFDDALSGALFGQSALKFLLLYGIVTNQRKLILFGRNTVWAMFFILMMGVTLLEWLILSLFYGHWIGIEDPFIGILISGLIYPLVQRGLRWLNQLNF